MKIILTDELLNYYGDIFQKSAYKINGWKFERYVEFHLSILEQKIKEKTKKKEVFK